MVKKAKKSTTKKRATKKRTASKQAKNRRGKNLVKAGASTRFQPGRSGNPGGRPKSISAIRPLLREQLGELAPCELCKGRGRRGSGKCRACDGSGSGFETYAQRIARVAIELAAKGDVRVIEWLVDQIDGPATQSHELELRNGQPTIPAELLRSIMRRANAKEKEAVH